MNRTSLARGPVIVAALSLLLVVLGSLIILVSGPTSDEPATTPRAEITPYTLPSPTQQPPRRRVDDVHDALHALGRACDTSAERRDPSDVRRAVDSIVAFATEFPSAGFRIDDEPGTTLALLIVARHELRSCAPSLMPRVQQLIPQEYRGG